MATISDPEAGDVTERESDDTQVSSAQAAPGADKGTHTTGDISCVDTSDTKRIEDITKKDKSEKEDKETEVIASEHVVRDRETLASIAALHEVTPSELVSHNRLGMSRMVFPGQVLRIPPPPPPPPPPPDPVAELEIVEYQFIKLRVRHITAGRGVVSGSVLFTPNAVIFDPDPQDPLVEELEPEAFQIIAPMEFVVNAAIFYDFFPLGSTGNTAGKEHPPSKIFSAAPDNENNKANKASPLQRQDTTGSTYSLCQENQSKEGDIDRQMQISDVKHADDADLSRLEPYYLRLTMGKPVNREVARSTPIMAYGKQTMWPEYWFIVQTRQIMNLYKFFNCWFPEIYGPFDLEEIHEMGMELVPEPEIEFLDEVADDLVSINTARQSRHMIHKTMTLNSIETELFLPEMSAASELFSDDQRKLLYRHLPPRVQGAAWTLRFSSSAQGFLLSSLYRACAGLDCPCLLVIQDTEHAVFGALLSHPPQPSGDKFVGTGESWLFTFYPSFKVYQWTGENSYILRAGLDNLIIGSSEGRFGLWLDSAFNQGRSQSVATFDNKPLPGREDFIVNNIECWAFE